MVLQDMAEVMFHTYDTSHQPEVPKPEPKLRGRRTHTKEYSLWRHYSGIATARTIIIASGVASAFPGLVSPSQNLIDLADNSTSTSSGKAIWYATNEAQTITSAEHAIFLTAGYPVTGYFAAYGDVYGT